MTKEVLSQQVVDILTYRAQQALSMDQLRFCANNSEIAIYVEERMRRLIADVSVKLLGKRWDDIMSEQTIETVVKVDADWWQAFKARWFPKWLLKRYPAKTRDVVVKHTVPKIIQVYNVCPHLDKKLPHQESLHYHFMLHNPKNDIGPARVRPEDPVKGDWATW